MAPLNSGDNMHDPGTWRLDNGGESAESPVQSCLHKLEALTGWEIDLGDTTHCVKCGLVFTVQWVPEGWPMPDVEVGYELSAVDKARYARDEARKLAQAEAYRRTLGDINRVWPPHG